MKKKFACALVCAMCMTSLAACGSETSTDVTPTATTAPVATTAPTEAPVDTVSDLVNAKNYLFTMYKDQNEATPVDYTVVGVVNIGGVMFNIDWTVDHDSVKIVPGDNKMVTIDVDDQNPEEVTYTLTATLSDAAGAKESCSFTRRVPAAIVIDDGMSYADIVDAAYALEDGLSMEGTFRLYGTITNIDTAWSEDYQNITVTIAVAGREDKPVMCYRLKGDGAKNLAVGDAITVEGVFKNYKGTIEFDAGCTLVGYGEHKDYTALLEAAYTLEDGLSMNEPCTMSGVIHNIDTVWSEDYQNITVSMTVNGVEDKPIMCYRLKGDGAKDLAVGDYITVTGTIKNYKGTIEFDAGCTLDNVVKAAGSATEETPAPTEAPVEEVVAVDPALLLDDVALLEAAYALADGETIPAAAVLKGVIKSIDTEYSEQYGNITVTIEVGGNTEKPVQCFRLKGDGAAALAVGDEIALIGTLKNYSGTIEFDAGCMLVPVADYASVKNAVTAYALVDGGATIENASITGVVASVDTEYSEQYGNVTVTIVTAGLEDYKLECFRMKGDIAPTVAVGDTITVTGTLKNYKGKIEFDAGCIGVAASMAETPAEETPAPTETPVEETPAPTETPVEETPAPTETPVEETPAPTETPVEEVPAATGKAELNANDVEEGKIEAAAVFGSFTIVGSADAAVTVDANNKKSDTGLEFTKRIKLGGSGSLDVRNVSFTTSGAAKITVYAMSSSSSEDRALLLMNAEGTELGRGTALGKVEASTIPAMTFEVTEAGTYYLWSEASGINIYYISVE